jgi:histidyl-tRNA synthetase
MEQLLAKVARPSTVAEGPAGRPSTLVVPGTPEAFERARDVAAELRKDDAPIEMDVCGRNLEESLAYARAKGIETVVEVSDSGERKTHTVGIQ